MGENVGQGGITATPIPIPGVPIGPFDIVGCTDPLATNYNASATIFCINCCQYPPVYGCMDSKAINYNPKATQSCFNCCVYDVGLSTSTQVIDVGTIGILPNILGGNSDVLPIPNIEIEPSTIPDIFPFGFTTIDECCEDCVLCIDCNNFNGWITNYKNTHGGNTPIGLDWQKITGLIASGHTFAINDQTYELISEDCCTGDFVDGLCLCTDVIKDNGCTAICVSDITILKNLLSTQNGYDLFRSNFQSKIGPALDLITISINTILSKLPIDYNLYNSISLELSSFLQPALGTTGGFYVCSGKTTVSLYDKIGCLNHNGYWDDDNNICMCQPVVDDCVIGFADIKTLTTYDVYNHPIQIITDINDHPISEACCNRLVKDNPFSQLKYTWQTQPAFRYQGKNYQGGCFTTPTEDCLPVIFTLDDKPTPIPPCENDLEISMWVYFGKPANPCGPIPEPPPSDIIINNEFCELTATTNGTVVNNGGESILNQIDPDLILFGQIGQIGVLTPTPCCYSTKNPILAKISLTNPILNPYLQQVKTYNSATDYFDRWVELKATLPSSGLTLDFGVSLEIYQGLSCCCNYDIFVDNIRVDCNRQESSLLINEIECPGFKIHRVIDNKKSWTYNPGLPQVGISTYDDIIRSDGSFSLLNGHGTIDRTFAPSLDASIPWRYTDYWEQSSIMEKHSSLVLNSKELGLTFDMCADCGCSHTVCPDIVLTATTGGVGQGIRYIRYPTILSAGTEVCYYYKYRPGVTPILYTTSATTVTNTTSLIALEKYKKQFQSFWIPFMEQFIPATTIWVAGERWCSEICTVNEPCDYDFELVESEIGFEVVPPGFYPTGTTTGRYWNTDVYLPQKPIFLGFGDSDATVDVNTSAITTITDLGLLKTMTLDKSNTIDIISYRNRFTSITTKTEYTVAPNIVITAAVILS